MLLQLNAAQVQITENLKVLGNIESSQYGYSINIELSHVVILAGLLAGQVNLYDFCAGLKSHIVIIAGLLAGQVNLYDFCAELKYHNYHD